jgi:hypothetical protein
MAMSVHSMVLLSMVNSRYIFREIYTGLRVSRYLPAGVRRPDSELVSQRPHNVTGPDMIDSDLNLQDANVGSARDRP